MLVAALRRLVSPPVLIAFGWLPLVSSTLVGSVGLAQAAHPVVAGFERFHASDEGDADSGGLLLLGELNCTACHTASTAAATQVMNKQAPILDAVGSRVRPEYLRAYLADPQRTKPGTTMPNLFAGVSPEQKERQVEALVHLLASTGQMLDAAPVTPAVLRGEQLYHSLGCAACHDARREGAPQLATSVPLPPQMEAKYSVPALAAFLANPLAVRPSARMPHLNLSAEEARDIACYLLRELEVPSTLEFAYYEGNWQELPDFAALEPKTQGTTNSFDVNLGRPDQFGVVFTGKLRVPRDGKYTFHLGSDDGSRLLIDGRQMVDVDGIHPLTFRSGAVELRAGMHEIRAEYFEQGGEQELRVEVEGPELPRQAVEYILVAPETDNAPDQPGRLTIDPALVVEGRRVFESIGCAACHTLQLDGQRLASRLNAKPLGSLAGEGGCLGAAIQAPVPQYALSSHQRAALGAAVTKLKAEGAEVSPRDRAAVADRALTALNCYACHQRGGRGGVEEQRNAWFLSNQPEMGDEGRLPPHLDGVAAKLNEAWLNQVLDRGEKARPYMFTRMPKFGVANTEPLIAALRTLDPPITADKPAVDIPDRRLKATGRFLAGEGGLSCIKCHTWGDVPATGIQAIDLTTMTQRLQPAWFRSYMLDPQQYRPGTRMPAAWPMGQVLLPKVLDGQAATQIHSIWTFLSDGRQAAMPVGLGPNPMPLVAYVEPVMYRNFIEGAGPRAIGVGYPEKVNLAFDANNLRLALIWHNAFIDAAKHWVGRGPGFQKPLGDNVLALPDGVPFARLDAPTATWPSQTAKELGYQFDGYRLDDNRRPTFLYHIGEVAVEDHFKPASKTEFAPLQRTLRLTGPATDKPLYFRAAAAKSIEPLEDGWYEIEGTWKLQIESPELPLLRDSEGRKELLVPISIDDNVTIIREMIQW